jgi:hypothetical protein
MDAAVQTREPSPAKSPWRTFLIVAVSISIVCVGYLTIEAMWSDAANQALLNDLFRPKFPPPARVVVCEGAMDATCAQEAADEAFTVFAWLKEPTGYDLAWVAATGNPKGPTLATEYLLDSDGEGMIEVVTAVPAIGVEPGTSSVSSISNGTDTASVWVDEQFGVVSIEWTHERIGYLITAQPRPWDPSAVVEAWKTIRYTAPTPVD